MLALRANRTVAADERRGLRESAGSGSTLPRSRDTEQAMSQENVEIAAGWQEASLRPHRRQCYRERREGHV